MDSKFVNSPRSLIFWFLVFPILISALFIWPLDDLLENESLKNFIYISGYLFTSSSLVLVFILFRRFRVSDYKKDEVTKIFLEGEAFVQLYLALTNIKACINDNDVTNLSVNCFKFQDVHKSLISYDLDTELKAYQAEIKSIFNLLEKHDLFNIGLASEAIKLEEMPITKKTKLISEIENLLPQLRRRSDSNEQ